MYGRKPIPDLMPKQIHQEITGIVILTGCGNSSIIAKIIIYRKEPWRLPYFPNSDFNGS